MATRRMNTALKALTVRLWLPIILLIVWESVTRQAQNIFFPPPSTIFAKILTQEFGIFWENTVAPTLSVMVGGFLVGSVIGLLAGVLIGSQNETRRIVYPIAVFLKGIPTAAKLPAILSIIGIGTQSLYFAVGLSVFLNVFVVTVLGIAKVHPTALETAKLLNLGWVRTTFAVKLPAAMGDILTGLQSALQISILVTVLVETLASGFGFGAYLLESQSLFRFPEMWGAIMLLGLIGLISNELFHFIERKSFPWFFAIGTER